VISVIPSGRLLTVDEVAQLVHLSPRTIYALVAAGRLPVVRFGRRRLRFDPQAVAEALQAGLPAPGRAP
jgi:excisionase family DNA binding protein